MRRTGSHEVRRESLQPPARGDDARRGAEPQRTAVALVRTIGVLLDARPAAPRHKESMTSRFARLLLATTMLLALALPAVASAHGGHGRDRGADRVCRAVRNNHVPRGVTAAQAQALAAACTTRANAIAAATTAFDTATASARATYRTTVAPLAAQLRTASQAKRTACRTDRASQACSDARAALRTTLATVAPQIRAARQTYRAAVAPALQSYRTAVRAAQDAFRASVNQILGRS